MLPSATPKILLPSVWPLPISLATTFGISVDYFSSPYLDVSVQAVPHAYLFDSVYVTTGLLWWVSPFGYPRIVAYLQLPEAFRSLSRPSSAPDAKAFPLRSYSLDLSSKQTPLIPFPSPPYGLAASFILLCCFSSPNFKHFVGLKFGVCRFSLLTSFAEKSISGFSSIFQELCRLNKKFFFS